MNFNRDSWHYFVLDKLSPFEIRRISNLCQLVRRLAVAMLVWIPICVTAVSGFTFAVLSSIYFDIAWLFGTHPKFYPWYIFGNAAMSVAALLTAGIVAHTFFSIWKEERRSKNTEPSVILSYIKAKKAKICPLVEYK